MLYKLRHYGVTGIELDFFTNYLCKVQYVEYLGVYSQKLLISTGVPQGSVLWPLLFLTYINKPNNGAIYHNIRSSKSRFKYALRSVRKSEEMIRADAMASDLLNNDQDSFWKEVKKLNSCKSILTNIIDGISEKSNITDLWKNHFCNILNANVCDSDLKNNIMVQLENI